VYALRPGCDWVETPVTEAAWSGEAVERVIAEVWGRPLEPAELRMLIPSSMPAEAESDVVEEVAGTETTP
jgi:hypothetical protein